MLVSDLSRLYSAFTKLYLGWLQQPHDLKGIQSSDDGMMLLWLEKQLSKPNMEEPAQH